MRIRLLGGFGVSVGSRTIEGHAWRLRKAANVVKLLALSPGYRMHREQIMNFLWPDLGTRAAANNLRGIIHAARITLGPDPVIATRYLNLQGEQIVLCPEDQLRVDVEAFEETAAAARRSRDSAVYRTAIELYSGELLPEDRYEEWAEGRRQELRRLHLGLLVELAELYEERGEYEAAVEALQSAVAEEPTFEEGHACLMRLHALSGRPERALAQFERLRDTLVRGLTTEPSTATRRLRDEIATGRLTPTPPTAPPQEEELPAGAKHNLPAPRTSFVGRELEMVEVKRTLAMTRLLTHTGAGGCGKTRLALEVAKDLIGAYPDGVWLVELAPITESALVVQEVAGVLGVREQPGRSLVEALVDALHDKELLLVLDNCEHLVDACAHLVDTLLTSCPRLRILATGREPLGVEGEVIWQVFSLSVPDTDRLPAAGELTRYEAVRLFVDRARLRLPDFELTLENSRAVAEVCGRLEGMPLAIELATARVGALTVGQISERLGDSLALLAAGPRTAAPRQRTMRATLEWSYGLLSEPEQMLFRGLSVFVGGWTLEAAEAVGSVGMGEADVLDCLGKLVDKSLVVAELSAGDRTRYRMLEPVRQYVREKLDESGETEAVRRLQAAWYLALAERAAPELRGSGQVEWLKVLEEEHDNLRAVMTWLLEGGRTESAVRLAYALLLFWYLHGHQSEVRRWTEEALTKEDLPDHVRAKALVLQGLMLYGLCSPEQPYRLFEEAAALFRGAGDNIGWAQAAGGMGLTTLQQGRLEEATAHFEEALELFRRAEDKWGVSSVLAHLGAIPLGQGNHALAARYFEEALELTREIGNMISGYVSLYNLALAAQGQGDHERAAGLYAEGLSFAVDAGDKANTAYCLEGLAELAEASGELQRAAKLFGAAEALLEDAGGVLYAQAQDRSLRDQMVNALRSRLDETALAAAWAEGRAMTPEQAAEYALSEEEPFPSVFPVLAQPSIGTQPTALTDREKEVAALVARGFSNRRVASELSISKHTVATHVGKIMRKLRLSSRSQIAAWVADQQGRPSSD